MKTKEICLQGLLVALVAMSTMMFRIPVSATNGYIHLGDSLILLSAVFFGRRSGMVAGGLGSMLADILSGYGHWAPFTLIIKGLMGFAIGAIADFPKKQNKFFTTRNVLGGMVGIAWMVVGYFFAGSILTGSFATAMLSIPENMVQGVGGYVIFSVIGIAFYHAGIYRFAR